MDRNYRQAKTKTGVASPKHQTELSKQNQQQTAAHTLTQRSDDQYYY